MQEKASNDLATSSDLTDPAAELSSTQNALHRKVFHLQEHLTYHTMLTTTPEMATKKQTLYADSALELLIDDILTLSLQVQCLQGIPFTAALGPKQT